MAGLLGHQQQCLMKNEYSATRRGLVGNIDPPTVAPPTFFAADTSLLS